jgi:hypothetical protein
MTGGECGGLCMAVCRRPRRCIRIPQIPKSRGFKMQMVESSVAKDMPTRLTHIRNEIGDR